MESVLLWHATRELYIKMRISRATAEEVLMDIGYKPAQAKNAVHSWDVYLDI